MIFVRYINTFIIHKIIVTVELILKSIHNLSLVKITLLKLSGSVSFLNQIRIKISIFFHLKNNSFLIPSLKVYSHMDNIQYKIYNLANNIIIPLTHMHNHAS